MEDCCSENSCDRGGITAESPLVPRTLADVRTKTKSVPVAVVERCYRDDKASMDLDCKARAATSDCPGR